MKFKIRWSKDEECAHNHVRETHEVLKLALLHRIRDRCMNELTSSMTIYKEETGDLEDNVILDTVPAFPKIVRTMCNWKNLTRPKNPTSLREWEDFIDEEPERGQAIGRKGVRCGPFYRGLITGPKPSLLFLSEFMKNILEDGSCVLAIDGTFKVVPNVPQAYQILTISAILHDMSFPLSWTVMTSKSTAAYVEIFKRIKVVVPGIHPKTILANYEGGLQKAIRKEFRKANLVGCWVHFMRAVKAKRTEKGITNAVLEEGGLLKDIYYMSLALPLLPADDMEVGIQFLEYLARNDERPQAFLKYLRSYWLPQRNTVSVFHEDQRTNNYAEAHHRQLQRLIGTRPNPWVLLKGLLLEEKYHRGNYQRLIQHGNTVNWEKNRKYQRTDIAIRKLMAKHERGNVDAVRKFLRIAKYYVIKKGEPAIGPGESEPKNEESLMINAETGDNEDDRLEDYLDSIMSECELHPSEECSEADSEDDYEITEYNLDSIISDV